MKELLNSLTEMLDRKDVESICIQYSKNEEGENLSANIFKKDEIFSCVCDGGKGSTINVTVEGTTLNSGQDIGEIVDNFLKYKRTNS